MVKRRNHEKGYVEGLARNVREEIDNTKFYAPESAKIVSLAARREILGAVGDRLLEIMTGDEERTKERLGAGLLKLEVDELLRPSNAEMELGGGVEGIRFVAGALEREALARREHNSQRAKKGIADAQATGKHVGRPPMDFPEGFGQILIDVDSGALTITAAAKQLGVARKTFYRLRDKYEEPISEF